MVQINDLVETFCLQFLDHLFPVILQKMQMIYIRIVFHNSPELWLDQVMDAAIRQLLFQAAHYRSGQHNIANGRKPDYKKLHDLN